MSVASLKSNGILVPGNALICAFPNHKQHVFFGVGWKQQTAGPHSGTIGIIASSRDDSNSPWKHLNPTGSGYDVIANILLVQTPSFTANEDAKIMSAFTTDYEDRRYLKGHEYKFEIYSDSVEPIDFELDVFYTNTFPSPLAVDDGKGGGK
ncbi:MAG: hypothetical protein QM489_01035 [Candidatus Izemoplasma sp.]